MCPSSSQGKTWTHRSFRDACSGAKLRQKICFEAGDVREAHASIAGLTNLALCIGALLKRCDHPVEERQIKEVRQCYICRRCTFSRPANVKTVESAFTQMNRRLTRPSSTWLPGWQTQTFFIPLFLSGGGKNLDCFQAISLQCKIRFEREGLAWIRSFRANDVKSTFSWAGHLLSFFF